jgi:uncharacterized protein (DUF433 family)
MSAPFSLRLREGAAERLGRRARRTGIPARTLAQRYVEEGLRHDDHPLIQFVDGPTGRRAALVGTGLDVWEVIATVRDNANELQKSALYLGVSLGIVQAAVGYYGDYREEIDEEIALNESEWERGYASWEAGQRALGS